ncbi:hypothetical protein [Nocardia sp. CC227C]|uniref:hypothetical protein n=1 Tax=Nocardia sp. CC227C TaxID=3044562 RepID=UPI00278C7556|nr:hypothetical protein [Nocardia sp. CC227C]
MTTVAFTVPPSWNTEASMTELSCEAATVGEALTWFCDRYPPLRKRFMTDNGIAPWALVCLNHTDVRTLHGLDTPITHPGSDIQILAALMGG